jgi:hypothetical protein
MEDESGSGDVEDWVSIQSVWEGLPRFTVMKLGQIVINRFFEIPGSSIRFDVQGFNSG